jgi:alkanesulfonate monooxygenase SsuD/methylene tetrahydromethanopterin reductase-like flavin-dependent oxidoreductase (luciferase family)
MLKVGVLYQGLPDVRPSQVGSWVESLGYDSIWTGDHVLSYVDGIALAMALGAATQRLTVGNAILLVPLRNPALLARSLATLEMEMPGRYVLAAGAGGDVPAEFEVTGVELAGRGARMDEMLRTVRTALDDGNLGGHEFKERPTRGCPPIWFGGRTERAARRVAESGDGFIPYLVTARHWVALMEQVGSLRARGPRAGHPFARAADVMVSVRERHEDARADAFSYRAYGLEESQIERHTALGTPDEVIEHLAAFVDAGVEHLVLHVTAPPDTKRDQIELLSSCIDTLRARVIAVQASA